MQVLFALLPILVVAVLMVGFTWSSQKAMPIGFLTALVMALAGWQMPVRWLAAASIAGVINAIDILLIVYGALVILQMMRKSGGIDAISRSMASISDDRRVQIIIIAWLMGCFLEGAAGFGTPAAVAAPLLVGMGFPPLIAAAATLMADSTPVTFGAVGVPIWGGFAAIRTMVSWPLATSAGSLDFVQFLQEISAFSGIVHLAVGTFVPLVIVSVMTKITRGSFRQGLEVWPLALLGGLVFTVPQMLIAVFVGPELPTLLGSLIGLPLFILLVKKGVFTPKTVWTFPPHTEWPPEWEGAIRAGDRSQVPEATMGSVRAWIPYVIIGVLLLASRVQYFGLTPLLREFQIGWDGILGTTIGRSILPLYNPGVFPFLLVALLIPFMHGIRFSETLDALKETARMIVPATVALVFTLGMVYIMMNTGGATGADSMLIVLAQASAALAGDVWYIVAPFIGLLGTFISGSNTVSDIMFGPFQFSTAASAGKNIIAILALQAVGGAAGNMIAIHNVVAALTTVGLVGKEGVIIRKNLWVALGYCLAAGIAGWLLAGIM
ncbi:MAG: L-lactate permease [Spirochaetota bacterium]